MSTYPPRGGSATISLDVLEPRERLRLFRETQDRLEPPAVWLSVDGMPHRAQRWEETAVSVTAEVIAHTNPQPIRMIPRSSAAVTAPVRSATPSLA